MQFSCNKFAHTTVLDSASKPLPTLTGFEHAVASSKAGEAPSAVTAAADDDDDVLLYTPT
jgi:hypothetical protein